MEAQQVIDKILSEAKASAERITADAKQVEADEQAKMNKHLDSYKTQSKSLADGSAEAEKLHVLAASRMEISKELLAQKRELLDKVFVEARKKLIALDDEVYKKLFSELMVKAVETGDEEVIVDTNEKRIDHELIKSVNRELGPSFKGNLRLSETKGNIGCGFILQRGDIKNNVSADVLISQARKELEVELAKQLFAS